MSGWRNQEGQYEELPDLWATTPEGASWCRDVESFLVEKGWKFKHGRDTAGQYWIAYTVLRREIQARSHADILHAAIRAVEGGGDG